jgi:peptidoglycan/LPS O-acetylase OafA/YrhL
MTNTEHHNPHIKYRPDIDGLRAIALFFILSYMITVIILKGLK